MIREFAFVDFLYLLAAARWTVALAAIAFVGGGLLGLGVALLRVVHFAPLRWVAATWILVVQGTPLLAWLFLFYFGLAIVGIRVSPWIAAATAFSIYASAFLGEIWRGSLQSIPKTQWEAGASLGLGFGEQLRYVIVPQAVRVAIPPTVGFLVQLVKNTSLAAVIGFVELTREGQLTTAATFRPFTVYIVVAAIYFSLCFPLTLWSRALERRLHVARRTA
ncbi:MAG TPA: amino acid ABC transporter permease [Beijerinckiaceae bacterium]|nr:amino acid ABC transporter permease [Beijerinckiaceae bacterium]